MIGSRMESRRETKRNEFKIRIDKIPRKYIIRRGVSETMKTFTDIHVPSPPPLDATVR